MAEIVWVYGASAAGKETFIHAVLAKEAVDLRQEFGWRDKAITACQESLQWIAHYPDDQIAQHERFKLSSVIPALAEKYEVVLLKGQDIDLALGTPLLVKRSLPQSTHHIIFIDVQLDELFRRVTHKPWWSAATKRAEEEGWLEEQIDRLMEIQNQLKITAINSKYQKVPFRGNFI
jgi:hypothetical protein